MLEAKEPRTGGEFGPDRAFLNCQSRKYNMSQTDLDLPVPAAGFAKVEKRAVQVKKKNLHHLQRLTFGDHWSKISVAVKKLNKEAKPRWSTASAHLGPPDTPSCVELRNGRLVVFAESLCSCTTLYCSYVTTQD